ncbi:MAG: hypothetical protein EBZ36_13570, partial [Acidobacteria bacterium]|nr:hypothetical protein [Acidobacteriota bacterium]
SRANIGDAARVWYRNYGVYIRLWRTEIIAPLFDPIFSVIGFGMGIGSLIAGDVMGVPYLTFVGAGVLAFAALLRALFECTYGSYFRMVYQSTFDAILCTPVEAESLALGEIAWGVTKALFDGLIVLLVLWAFGAILSPWGLLIPVVLSLGALWLAALSLLITARIHDINHYNFYLAVVFSYFWISGNFFPLASLPGYIQWLAWAVPLTSVVDASRELMTGRLNARLLPEVLYLVVSSLVMIELAMRALRRRMVS